MHILSSLRNSLLQRSASLNYSEQRPLKFLWRTFKRRVNREDGGMNLAPQITGEISHKQQNINTILKCSLFTVGFCGTAFVGAAIYNYENMKKRQTDNLSQWLTNRWNKVGGFEHKEGEFRQSMNRWWNEIHDGTKLFWGICAANIMVFLCWRYPPLQSTMMRYFCSSPAGRVVCWPMFLSTFSHYAPIHIFLNMYVLHSFSPIACEYLGPEHLLGFYLSGGVIASLSSNIFKLLTHISGPSLGASGAIMALLGYFCTKRPDAQLGIVFIPNFHFSADYALKGIMLFDLLGMLFRWKMFDHAAHLGGAVFGLMYAMYGQSLIWNNRSIVTKQWESFSEKYLSKSKK